MENMKSIFVGTYILGYRPIRIYAHPLSRDGSVKMTPVDKGATIVNLGINHSWSKTLAVFFHESYELALIDLGARFGKNPSYSEESSDFMFFMTHNQLGEAHEMVGELAAGAVPDLQKVHDRFKKKRKKK
jgi:hypothetical protein